MSERKPKPLVALEARARRLMLMAGLGMLAFVTGKILTAMLIGRLHDRLVAADSAVLFLIFRVVVGQLWILFVLPALIHLAARFLELAILRTAIIAAATGLIFNLAIGLVSSGLEQTFADPLQNAILGGSLIAGVLISVWAGKQGRAWAEDRQRAAEQEAIGRKAEYDRFLAESTALAERSEAAPEPVSAEVDQKPPV